MMMKSKKSRSYSPKYGVGFPSASSGPLMNVWNIVKNILPFFGTFHFFAISLVFIRTRASSGKAEKALNA